MILSNGCGPMPARRAVLRPEPEGRRHRAGGRQYQHFTAGVPLILSHDLRNMDHGFSVLFSHRTKGTVHSYIPYPTELPHLREICALDPSA